MVHLKRQHIFWLVDSSSVSPALPHPQRPYVWQREDKEKDKGAADGSALKEEQYVEEWDNKC